MHSSVTVTIHHATSSRDAASAGRGFGVHAVSETASASMASVTRLMVHVPVCLGTVGSSAGSHVLLDFMVKTAGSGGIIYFLKSRQKAVYHYLNRKF